MNVLRVVLSDQLSQDVEAVKELDPKYDGFDEGRAE